MSESEPDQSTEELAVAQSLGALRPVPTPAFRGGLARRLVSLDPGYGHRPEWLWQRAGVLAGAGVLLVLLGLLVSSGTI